MIVTTVIGGSERAAKELRSGMLRLHTKFIHGSRDEVEARGNWRFGFDLVESNGFDLLESNGFNLVESNAFDDRQ